MGHFFCLYFTVIVETGTVKVNRTMNAAVIWSAAGHPYYICLQINMIDELIPTQPTHNNHLGLY